MQNRFSGYCHICGAVVEAGEGLAVPLQRKPGEPGWGQTNWVVQCKNPCAPPAPEDIERKDDARESAEHDAGTEGQQIN